MLTKRTNILFSEQTWSKLTRLAQKRGSSVGELVRDAVQDSYFDDKQNDRAAAAYHSIIRHRKRVPGKIDYKELINEGRRV